MTRVAALLLAALLALLPLGATAQGVASLLADSLSVTEDGRLVARGNVEVLYDGTRLTASAVTYSREGDRLTIEGPILITTPEGQILEAERAELDPQLENGLLRSARLVLDRQLQLEANRIDRAEGSLTQLYKTAATSCRVCGDRDPLWEIRAKRVIHDEAAQQLYFENAQFRVKGVPILWLPRMRLPDPTLERARGLLIPQIRSNDTLGTGVKLPYFIPLGPSRDLLLTPYLSPRTRTLELRYRQAYRNGDLAIEGAVTQDNLERDGARGYVFAEGVFDLGADFRLDFDLQGTTDRAYLVDYDYSDADQLESGIALTRIRAEDRLRLGLTRFESLRNGEEADRRPSLLSEGAYERVMPDLAGGTFTWGLKAEGAWRRSDALGPGRDVRRLGGSAQWSASRVLPAGILASADFGFEVGHYQIGQDPAFPDRVTRTTPSAEIELRWPLSRSDSDGSAQLLEPVLQLAWSETYGGDVPNEDSQVVELDEANLTALTRFPGEDRREEGLRGAIGLGWTRIGAGGWESQLTFGRVLRTEEAPAFPDSSGLVPDRSDWLLTGAFDLPSGLSLDARGLFDSTFEANKAEARLQWDGERVALDATYILLPSDPGEGRPEDVSEWTLDGAYRFSDIWQVSAEARYDLAANEPTRSGFGVEYSNECVTVELSASRRYTSSDTLQPSTDYGLTVALNGFSAGRSDAPVRRSCK